MAHQRNHLGALLLAITLLSPLSGCASGGRDPVDGFIAKFRTPSPGEAARDAFNVYDADTRRRSVALLANARFGGESAYLRLYRLLIDDPDPTVRAACCMALGNHGTVDDVKLLVDRLKDDAAAVRWEAAKALQKIHNPIAAEPLIAVATKDADADVRMSAAYALGQYPQPAVFNALASCLDDLDFGVVARARQALRILTGYDFGSDASLWLIWAKKHESDLFARGKTYTYEPFYQRQTTLEKMQFWRPDPVRPEPRQPTGMN